MPKQLDREWFARQAATDADREKVMNILKMREQAIREHIFYTGDNIITLRLGSNLLSMRECSAPATIEVYYELFREDDHFLHKDFFALDVRFVVDIGANEGFYALRIAANSPSARIICVEPNPFAFEILSMNIENNGLKNVVPINVAVSCDGRLVDMEFVRQIPAIGGAKLRDVERSWLKEDIVHKRVVRSVTVEQIVAQYSFRHIDILKIDVEGMEDEIVKSLAPVAKKIRKIVVERHSKNLRDIVTNNLSQFGFELVYEEDPQCERYYGDLYFVNKDVEV
ncbi:MAG: FkbM family methyltransferase [Proteobacteria bacterium]|nr:FkbM family methyltransferase [Pseudomonadota bacterium]